MSNKIYILTSQQVLRLRKAIDGKERQIIKNKKELKGMAVQPGVVKGKVKLVLDLARLKEVSSGDILVTPMTRPQFNQGIKLAAGIITDEGGLLCHAAILAREHNIPCIVGTKIATQIFKDGDLVEMDANSGWVRKISK